MQSLTPSHFFDLNAFEFRSIFNESVYVWDILPKIKEFLNSHRLGKIEGSVSDGAYLINPDLISIGSGSVVEPGAYIKGPCLIGKNCTIRHGAYIRGLLIAGDGCVIGHDTEIKNTLMLNNAKAAHFAYLGDCILGNDVNLGAGTKCANLRLDHGQITIHYNGVTIDTGLKKFGAIFGDRSQTGCNSVTNPGTIFGRDVFCHPCTNPKGLIPENHIIAPESKLVIKSRPQS